MEINNKIFVFVGVFLVGVLMIGLVSGAGYNIVVPSSSGDDSSSSSSSSSGGGGGAAVNTTNATSNETISDGAGEDEEGVVEKTINEGVEKVTEFVKNIDWKVVVAVLVSLAVIGGIVWYFLIDKRKKFVEIRTKNK